MRKCSFFYFFLLCATLTAQDSTLVRRDSVPPVSQKAQKTRADLATGSIGVTQTDSTLTRIAAATTLPDTGVRSQVLISPSANTRPRALRFLKGGYPSPTKALLLSVALPGAGQAYNRQYWKIPLVYGGLATFGYLYYDNRKVFNRLKAEYIARVDDDPATVGEPVLQGLSTANVRYFRDKYRLQSEQLGLGFVVTYLLAGAEAYVAAHLKTFDVSDDLSLRFGPTQGLGVGVYVGLR